MNTIENTLGSMSVFETIQWLQSNKDMLIVSASEINKIKAEGINEAAEALYCLNVSDGRGDEDEFAIRYFKSYANKMEQGE